MCRRRIHSISFLLVSGLVLTSVAGAADPSLVGWWKLDETSGRVAADSSGYGNNGTVNGTAAWVTGVFNGALQFDGYSTWVDCGNDASLELTDSVTITAWIKMSFAGGDRKIAGNQDYSTGGYKFGVYSNNLVEFEIRSFGNASTLNRTSAGGTTLQPGTWYHVAGVYSQGQSIRTYVNGHLDRELTTAAVLGSSTGSFKLGREAFSSLYYWLGAMDDVAVFSRALTAAEIQAVMVGLEASVSLIGGGPSTEDFETNDFRKYRWVHGGNANWVTSAQERHGGLYSAVSGPISDGGRSVLQVSLACTSGQISFYRKVSSEAGCDRLRFFIDGEEKGNWSGDADWESVSFPVAAGLRTFEWVYSKDASASEGADAAWIDDLMFSAPALPRPAAGPIIVRVVRANGEWDNRAPIGQYHGATSVLPTQAGGLKDGNLCFSDRTYPWARTPAQLVGAEYVRTFNSDKKSTTVTYAVTTSREAIVMIAVDDRIFDQQGAANLATARFAPSRRFVDIGLNLYIHEDAGTDRPQSIFSARLPAGTYVFDAMRSEGNFYTIAAMD